MDVLNKLLAGDYSDPETGERLSVPVKSLVIQPSLAGSEAELVKTLDLERPYAILSDDHTHRALGHRVEKALASSGKLIAIRLGDRPHPDDKTADRVMREGEKAGAYIAVGSGSIC